MQLYYGSLALNCTRDGAVVFRLLAPVRITPDTLIVSNFCCHDRSISEPAAFKITWLRARARNDCWRASFGPRVNLFQCVLSVCLTAHFSILTVLTILTVLHSLLFLVTYYSDAIKKLLIVSYSVGPGVVVGRTLLNQKEKGFYHHIIRC